MRQKYDHPDTTRRTFLQVAGLGTIAAAGISTQRTKAQTDVSDGSPIAIDGTGGYIAFSQEAESAARTDGIDVPDFSITGVFDEETNTWEADPEDIEFPTISDPTTGSEIEVSAASEFEGTFDTDTGALEMEGALELSIPMLDTTFETDISATTEDSGELSGAHTFDGGEGEVTLVDNEFSVDGSGNDTVDSTLGFPSSAGENWLELDTDVELSEVVDSEPETGDLEGTVTDDDGEPVRDATVDVVGEVTTTTDSDGLYTLEDLDPGTYELNIDADDHIETTVEATVEAGTTVVEETELEPSPEDLLTIDGTGGYVAFGEEDEESAEDSQLFIPDFSLVGDLDEETETFDVSPDNLEFAEAEESTTGVGMSLTAPDGFEGTFDDQTGDIELEGTLEAEVSSEDIGIETTVGLDLSLTTGESGAMSGDSSFDRESGDGEVTLVDNVSSIAASENSIIDETLGLPAGAGENWIELDADIEAPDIDSETATSEIEGELTDEEGDPIEGATIDVVDESASTTTDGDGSYAIDDLEPGSYELAVDASGYPEATVDTVVEAEETTEEAIELEMPEDSIFIEGTDGYIAFGETSEADAPDSASDITQFSILGELDEEGDTWEADPEDVSIALSQEIGDPVLTAPEGLDGTFDKETGEIEIEGTIRLELQLPGDGDSADVGFDVSLTTGTSGELDGNASFNGTVGTVTLVDNEFQVDDLDTSIDDAIALPSDSGNSWLVLEGEVEVAGEATAGQGSGEDADDDGPGFGIGSAIAGLGGAGYLLKKHLASDTDTNSE